MKRDMGLTNKVIAASILLIVMPIFIIGILFYNNSKQLLEQQQENTNLKNIEDIDVYYIQQMTGRIDEYLNTWAADPRLEKLSGNANISRALLAEWGISLKAVPDITSIYLGSSGGNMYLMPPDKLPADYDPRTRPWYISALKQPGETVWTPPYLDAGASGMILSVAKQVTAADGSAAGVLSIDIRLNKLVQIVKSIKLGKNGYVVLLDANGTAISIPNAALLGKDIHNYEWVEQAYAGKHGSVSTEINGKKVIMSYITDAKTGWKLIGIMPKEEMAAQVSAIKNYMNTLLAIIVIWGVLACIALSFYLKIIIFKPIQGIMHLMGKVETGDLTVSVEHNYKDEIGQLYHGFNNMLVGQKAIVTQVLSTANNLKLSAEQASQIAHQTSDTSQNQSFAMVELTKAIEDMSISITDVTSNISDIAGNIENITISMQQMGIAADEVAKNTEETSQAMCEVADSVKGMDQAIALISSNSNSANVQGEKSFGYVIEGKKIIDSTIVEMDNIDQSMKDLSLVTSDLGKAATQIGEIVEVIDDISEQTNLLSLNASIEAARAGEHGKGFAVVAGAIGRLSEKSSESTKDIEKIVKHIQSIVTDAVATSLRSAARIETGVGLVTNTEAAFSNIYTSIEETTKLINQIAQSTTEQKEASNTIMAATNRVSDLTMQVSAASEQQLATVEEIVLATEKVNELTQNVSASSEVQAANSEEIAATSMAVNEMTTEVSAKSDEVKQIAGGLTEQAGDLMDVVVKFKV